jgi:hypothetical protein
MATTKRPTALQHRRRGIAWGRVLAGLEVAQAALLAAGTASYVLSPELKVRLKVALATVMAIEQDAWIEEDRE